MGYMYKLNSNYYAAKNVNFHLDSQVANIVAGSFLKISKEKMSCS